MVNATVRLLQFLAVFLFSGLVSTHGQAPWPSWAAQPMATKLTVQSHPALLSVPESRTQGIPNGTWMVMQCGDAVHFNPWHGDLAILRENGNLKQVVPTGLQYVFAVIGHPQGGVSASPSDGILVIGVDTSGVCRLRYAAYAPGCDLAALSFTDLIANGFQSERFSSAGFVGTYLYVYDMVARKIQRLIDANNDGFPDSVDPVLPYVYSASDPVEPRITGFCLDENSGHYLVDPRHPGPEIGSRTRIVVNGNGLDLVTESGPLAAPRPYVVGNGVPGNAKIVRVMHTRHAGEVWFENLIGNRISNSHIFSEQNIVGELTFSQRPTQNAIVILKCSDGTSEQYSVGAPNLTVYPGGPQVAYQGEAFSLDGANLVKAELVVKIWFDDDNPVVVQAAFVGTDRIMLTAPELPIGRDSMVLQVGVERSNGETARHTLIVIRPSE